MVSENEIDAMVKDFSHSDPSIAYTAADNLKKFVLGTDHSERIFRALVIALESNDQSTRAYAADVFSYAANEGIDITTGVPALTKALTDKWNVRMNAFDALKAAAINGIQVPFDKILNSLFESIEIELGKGRQSDISAKQKGQRQFTELSTAMRKQKQPIKGVLSEGKPKAPAGKSRGTFRTRRVAHV